MMGLYELELSKQLHLRNRQKREWEMLKKKMIAAKEEEEQENSRRNVLIEAKKKEEDRNELAETEVSKNLASAMVRSARETKDDTLQKAVELLQNQNGTYG